MKFQNLRIIHRGKFLTRYDLCYETENGRSKQYEIISRNPSINSFEELHSGSADAVVMIIHDETGEKLLLNREYRMAVGEWVYNFPAGLIDKGEICSEAAVRELREETGLRLERISEIWKESYSAVGFSNEKTVVVTGVASGEIRPSDSDMEEIQARWFTRAELSTLLQNEMFASRTQAYCPLWCRK